MYLDQSTFKRYREELNLFKPEDFHIGPLETSSKSYVRMCCGGNTEARLKGFSKTFKTEDSYILKGDFAASNSLIGYMEASFVFLFFENTADYCKWRDDGVELDFLRYNDNSQKTFAVSCPELLDLNELSEILDARVVVAGSAAYSFVRFVKTKPNRYIDSMVLVPSGMAPYQSEPTIVPKDARGMSFSGYIMDTSGCDTEGAVFYGCQKYVEGALNYDVGAEITYSNIRRPLLVGQSLITQGLYEYVMGNNPSEFRDSLLHPVGNVSWFDLLYFCNKLSKMQGFRPCYYDIVSGEEGSAEWDRSANGYRLLTEREWEYIARANCTFEYSGSDIPSEVAWYDRARKAHPSTVGTKKCNSFGTYDQSGNMWEWCWDKYEPGRYHRVLRGSDFIKDISYLRNLYRTNGTLSERFGTYGGRLARSIDP